MPKVVIVVGVILAASRALADVDPCRAACLDYVKAAPACPQPPLAELRQCVCDGGTLQDLQWLCEVSELPLAEDVVDVVPHIDIEPVEAPRRDDERNAGEGLHVSNERLRHHDARSPSTQISQLVFVGFGALGLASVSILRTRLRGAFRRLGSAASSPLQQREPLLLGAQRGPS